MCSLSIIIHFAYVETKSFLRLVSLFLPFPSPAFPLSHPQSTSVSKCTKNINFHASQMVANHWSLSNARSQPCNVLLFHFCICPHYPCPSPTNLHQAYPSLQPSKVGSLRTFALRSNFTPILCSFQHLTGNYIHCLTKNWYEPQIGKVL